MHLCFTNATELLEDAQTLAATRPARALSLAILALEEFGEIVLLCNVAAELGLGPLSWREAERRYALRSHAVKHETVAGYGAAILDRLGPKGDGPERYYEAEFPVGAAQLLDMLKRLCLYVDFIRGRFSLPSEIGRENIEWVNWVMEVARERLESLRRMHATEASSKAVARRAAELAQKLADQEGTRDLRVLTDRVVNMLDGEGNKAS
jgi:AbiV family abortive infection protein